MDVAIAISLPADQSGSAVEHSVLALIGIGLSGQETDGQGDESGELHV